MKSSSVLGAFLLTTIIIGATSALAQTPRPGSPMPPPPPATNHSPVVQIVTPRDGSVLLAPIDLHICASAAYFTDAVASVEFFAGTNSLGVATNSPLGLGGTPVCPSPISFFCLTWSNVPPDAYVLTAVAKDLAGTMVTSPPVDISVVTNLPPRVLITKPHNGATFLGPTNINICATAFDPDRGTVTQVEFFAGTNSLGVVTNVPVLWLTNRHGVFPIRNSSYCLTWSNAPLGDYVLTAVATDNDGATSTSPPVDIAVVTNLPPRVRLVSPYEGARYFAPATVGICATASDPDGTIASVEFFAGTNSLGVVTNGIGLTNRSGAYTLYCFTWSAAPQGTYALTAVATDNGGATATSAPVHIQVLAPPSPSVTITSPRNGATFLAPANIWICSMPRYFPDRVASVQYFAGTNSLGVVTNGSGFCFHWTNVPTGIYALKAIAVDVAGTNTATSPVVTIAVATNRPPIRLR